MSTQVVSPITTYFRVCDGVRVRFADNREDSDITALLLAPWPESIGAASRQSGGLSPSTCPDSVNLTVARN